MTTLPPDFIHDLKRTLQGEVRFDLASRILYSTDASIYQIEPLGVAFPRTLDDLSATVELAAKYHVPVLPRGSGSSLAGQAIGEALILDCSRYLDQIVEINPEARTATVQPGVILTTLNRAAAKFGLQYGPDPASADRATIGGVIGNNATGAHSILYGMTADHLLSADVVLSDGSLATFKEIGVRESGIGNRGAEPDSRLARIFSAVHHIRTHYVNAIHACWPTTWRNSAGYRLNYLLPWSPSSPPLWAMDDGRWTVYGQQSIGGVQSATVNLAPLLAGSEGTLAVIRTATLNLLPKPKHTVLAVLSYDGIAAACEAVPALLGCNPSAIELIPRMLIHLARDVPAYARQLDFVRGDPAALLVVEFSGDRPDALMERASALGADVQIAETPAAQARIWNVRKVGLGILDSRLASERPAAFIEDCAIPVERLGEFVREVERILADHGAQAAFYAHASAGCLHVRPILDLKSGQGVRALRSIAEQTLALTLRLGGAMSSEHGDGLARSEWLRPTYGEEIIAAFRRLKQAADPSGILNPGKIIDAPRMDVHLRYGEAYQGRAWTPVLDFSRNAGLANAIEQCNGAGVCRQVEGVMCPSFQASRDETFSTRGRANLLRAMISRRRMMEDERRPADGGRWPAAGELSAAVYSALDLCLACKGCKAECPSGVDMAKLKYEFQAHYYRTHRRPLRDYLFGYIGPLASLVSKLGIGKLANWLTGKLAARKLAYWAFGISAQRAWPRFTRPQSGDYRCTDPQSTKRQYAEACLYLPDASTHYFEPEIERAALELLAACGVEVKVLPVLGAGRTLISKGFLGAAKKHGARVCDAIQRLDPEGRLPVVGVEPAEIYTLRDEFLDLLPERAGVVAALASRVWMIDEYLVRPNACGQNRILRVANNPQSKSVNPKSKILLHGHCHQKTQPPAVDGCPVGVAASAELLRAVGYEVETIPSGCCGMAGAFGYEAEHYALSMQIGELALFPAVCQTGKGDGGGEIGVAAAGASCRAQIRDGTGVQAAHPVMLAAMKTSRRFLGGVILTA